MSAATTVERAVPALDRPLEAFLDELRTGRRLSPHTLDAYARDLADYRRFALSHTVAGWHQATLTLIDGYFASLHKRRLAASTVARRRSALRGFHGYLARTGIGAGDPLELAPAARRERKLPHALAAEEIERLLAQPEGDAPLKLRDRAMFELAYASGLRVSELTGIDLKDLDLDAETVAVTGKGSRTRPASRSMCRGVMGLAGTATSRTTWTYTPSRARRPQTPVVLDIPRPPH